MKPEPSLLGQMGLSIGGESIPFTMQAEASRMTIEEAVASGLFDMPDEPGMVRIPISVNVMIPNHLLWPPEPEPEPVAGYDPVYSPHGVPPRAPGSPPGHRFGNYPKGIAARNVMASFKSQMSPVAVAPVPGLPVAVAVAIGLRASPAAASVAADSTAGLLDAGAQAELRGLALTAGRGAVTGPVGAAVIAAFQAPSSAHNDVIPLPGMVFQQSGFRYDRVFPSKNGTKDQISTLDSKFAYQKHEISSFKSEDDAPLPFIKVPNSVPSAITARGDGASAETQAPVTSRGIFDAVRHLPVADLKTLDSGPIILAQDEELAGPAVSAARKLYRELQAEYAEIDQIDAELGFDNLTRPQKMAIAKLDNVVNNGALEKDFTGVAAEINDIDTGYDHIKEMKDNVIALQDVIKSISGSLRNPKLDELSKVTLTNALRRAQSTLDAFLNVLGKGS